ncbi:MAG: molybdenum cofactor guanylyltransferase MobA [Pseudomonadota bacterium]|nr:molybdenum cofactor guanylyltransferase MobA [Pseudomonadota bacterium]
MLPNSDICGLLLAGGRSRRMGGSEKCLMTLAGQTLLAHLIDIARPQVGPMVLNTNSDPALFSEYELPLVCDAIDGYAGPLAGVLTGLLWAKKFAPGCEWVASFACDAPFVPRDLVAKLLREVEAQGADMACAASGGRHHPVFALWPVRLATELHVAVEGEGLRKVDDWTARFEQVRVEFSAEPEDPFFNINRPGDLVAAEAFMGRRSSAELA